MMRLMTVAVVAGCVVALAASCGGGSSQKTGTAGSAAQGDGSASSPSGGSLQGIPSWATRAVANADPNVIQGLCEQAQSIANAGVNLSHNYHVLAEEFGQQWASNHNDTVARGETIYAAIWQHCGLPPVSEPAPSSTATASTSGSSQSSAGSSPTAPSNTPSVSWWGFQTPSHNIACNSDGASLRCVVFSASGTGGSQATWIIRAQGRPTFATVMGNIGTEVPSLAYGRHWMRSGITCDSEEDGLTCRNGAGHGFFLSREAQRVF